MNKTNEALDQDTAQPSVFLISWYLFLFIVFSVVIKNTQEVFLPLFASFILYFCFCPVVDKLEKLKIKRWISSLSLVLIILYSVGTGLYYLSSPVYGMIQATSKSFGSIEKKLLIFKKPMQDISQAEKKVDNITSTENVEVVQVKEQSMSATLLNEARDITFNFFTALVLFFFLLLYGDSLFCKLSKVLPYGKGSEFDGSLLSKIQKGTCFYLLTISAINTLLGCAIGGVLFLLDFQNPFVWGAVAGLLNFIPYVGCLIGVFFLLLISVTIHSNNFDIVLPALSYFFINSIEGQFLTPMIVGNTLRLNPLIILLSLIYWGYIWGVAGLFIAVPALIVLQIVGSQSHSLKEWTEALNL